MCNPPPPLCVASSRCCTQVTDHHYPVSNCLQTSFDLLDRSRLTVGSQRCELPDEELYDFDTIDLLYNVECTAGDETSEPGFYNASLALEKWCGSPES